MLCYCLNNGELHRLPTALGAGSVVERTMDMRYSGIALTRCASALLPSAPLTIAAHPATACELGQHVSRPLTRIAWLVRARLQMADGTRGHVGGVGAAQRCPVPARAQLARSDCHGKRCAPARVQLDSKLVLAHPMHVSLRRRRLAKEIPLHSLRPQRQRHHGGLRACRPPAVARFAAALPVPRGGWITHAHGHARLSPR